MTEIEFEVRVWPDSLGEPVVDVLCTLCHRHMPERDLPLHVQLHRESAQVIPAPAALEYRLVVERGPADSFAVLCPLCGQAIPLDRVAGHTDHHWYPNGEGE